MTSPMLDLSKVKYDRDFKIYFTYEDIVNLPEYPEGPLIELLNGELFMTPSPSTKHQRISKNLVFLLENFIRENNLGSLFSAPIDVVFSTKDVCVPDILYLTKENEYMISEKNIAGTPDFIIEILSSNKNNDLVKKKELYEKFGVSEYWIIDPFNDKVIQYRMSNGKYNLISKTNDKDELIETEVIGIKLKVSDIFA